MKVYFFYFLIFTAITGLGQDMRYMPLVNTDIHLARFGCDSSGVLLYNMHDNENTSAIAGRMIVRNYPGEYYELMHNGKRNISFRYGKDSIHIDPNRIYTDAGIWIQLEKNKIKDTLVHRVIAVWRDSLLAVLNIHSRELVIALHNNSNKGYSFTSYWPGEEYETEAYALYKGPIRDMDDFYFVTDHSILQKLAAGRFHVVLQDNQRMTDDGSLSVYCGQAGIPYINVEAEQGRLVRQIRMLMFAFKQLVAR
jgi:hypothetical protein